MPTISKGLKQAYDLQDLSYQAAMKIGVAVEGCEKFSREDANALAQLVRAWESCQERIRIHRNKPMPGSRRPAPEPEKPVRRRNHPPVLVNSLPPLAQRPNRTLAVGEGLQRPAL